jgi:squalene-hopene/tetraprenyl-beta-curcumene cyclase
VNVFTRIQLALFGAADWADVPTIPAELILAPKWLPVHLSKVSYWARTVVVPLLVLCTLRRARATRAGCWWPSCSAASRAPSPARPRM